VLRKATDEDMKVVEERAGKERHALEVCEEKVRAHNLEMKLVDVEYAFDGNKIVFYFTADGRVDFRALVRDLAAVFRTRIELRQIGVRDEVKMMGGLGPCGREACCRSFLKDFSPVSIRMAKDQNLSLNPTKISGLCGRLMCCLNYEQETYQSTLQRCPKKGVTVLTPEGPATIDDVLILREKVKVRLTGEEVEIREYSFDEVQEAGQKEIADWEASGGRARAAIAKAAYKQALNKPKVKPDDMPFVPYGGGFASYSDEPIETAGADAERNQPAVQSPEEPDGGDFEVLPDGDNGEEAQRQQQFPAQKPPQNPAQGRVQTQGQNPQRNPAQGSQQNPQNAGSTGNSGSSDFHRRRRRGGRRRGGFHGGPKT
jgi:cell fate regulator YaaT (PSP1 superfamily)